MCTRGVDGAARTTLLRVGSGGIQKNSTYEKDALGPYDKYVR